MSDLCLQITTHLSHTECPADEAESIRSAFFKEQELCKHSVISFLADLSTKAKDTIKSDIEAKLAQGTAEAERTALATLTAAAGKMHWSTWKAVVRRNGVFPKKSVKSVVLSRDLEFEANKLGSLNEESCRPMIQAITPSWTSLFSEASIASGYKEFVLAVVQRLQDAIDSASQDIIENERSQAASASARNTSSVHYRKLAKEVSRTVTMHKGEAWRQLDVVVEKGLSVSYEAAAAIHGAGSNLRSRQYVI